MDTKDFSVSCQDIFPIIEEQLNQGKSVRFIVSGISMTPWIINNRDQVEIISARGLTLKKGDIVLFQPFQGRYILHRITKILPDGYITTGDGNLYRDGFIASDSVIGKVIIIYRKGKAISCDRLRWKLLFRLWMALFPFRKYLFRFWARIRVFIRKQ